VQVCKEVGPGLHESAQVCKEVGPSFGSLDLEVTDCDQAQTRLWTCAELLVNLCRPDRQSLSTPSTSVILAYLIINLCRPRSTPVNPVLFVNLFVNPVNLLISPINLFVNLTNLVKLASPVDHLTSMLEIYDFYYQRTCGVRNHR